MGSKVIRNITKVFRSASGVLFGRATAGTGRGEELTPSEVRSLLSVYTISQTDTAISTAVNALVAGAPGLLDTLDELSAALGDDANFASTVATALAGKVDSSTLNESIDDRVAALLVAGTNISLTYNDASGTLTLASTASGGSPGGSSGQVQFNNAGAFGGMTAVVYAATGTHVTITSQAAATIPLCVKGAVSQSGNLTEWQNSSGTVLSAINASGNCVLSAGGTIGSSATNRIDFGTFLLSVNANSECQLISDNSAGNAVRFGNNNGGLSLRGIACTVYAFAGNALQITAGAGSGTNGAASAFRLRSGASTGNATPASILLQTTTTGASGATAQTHRSVIEVDGNTTSGETPMLLLDCAKGTLQRVSIGASDSGGTGFKVLRVPN